MISTSDVSVLEALSPTVDENGDLIQHVEPAENALYPILADPTAGDIDTTGQVEGVGWYDANIQPGEVVVHKIVEGSGGQSVETTTIRGGTASTSLTVNDTENGGYQPWTNTDTGVATYENIDGGGLTETQTFNEGNVYGNPDQVEFTQLPTEPVEHVAQADDAPGWTKIITDSVKPNFGREPLQPGEERPLKGDYDTPLQVMQERNGQPVTCILMERLGEDGQREIYRVDENPDGSLRERVVTETQIVDGQPRFVFDDGTSELNSELYRSDGAIDVGQRTDTIEDGDRRVTTFDANGVIRNDIGSMTIVVIRKGFTIQMVTFPRSCFVILTELFGREPIQTVTRLRFVVSMIRLS